MRSAPKRCFTDPSIAVAAMNIHKERLSDAIEKFERFYMADNGAKYHYEGIEQLLKTFTDKQEKQVPHKISHILAQTFLHHYGV